MRIVQNLVYRFIRLALIGDDQDCKPLSCLIVFNWEEFSIWVTLSHCLTLCHDVVCEDPRCLLKSVFIPQYSAQNIRKFVARAGQPVHLPYIYMLSFVWSICMTSLITSCSSLPGRWLPILYFDDRLSILISLCLCVRVRVRVCQRERQAAS